MAKPVAKDLSDAELDALLAGAESGAPTGAKPLAKDLSDEELDQMLAGVQQQPQQPPEELGAFDLLEAPARGLRAGISAVQQGQGLSDIFSAAGQQFQAGRPEAPGFSQILQQADIDPQNVFKAGIAGVGLVSPTAALLLQRGFGRTAEAQKKAVEFVGESVLDPINVLPLGQLKRLIPKERTRSAFKFITTGFQNVTDKLQSSLTGLNRKDIRVFKNQTKKISKAISRAGDDLQGLGDEVKKSLFDSIQKFEIASLQKVDDILQNKPNIANINVTPIVKRLESMKTGLNLRFPGDADTAKDIDGFIDLINSVSKSPENIVTARRNALVTPQDLNKIISHFDESTKFAKPGQTIVVSEGGQRAAKSAGRLTREIFRREIPDAGAIRQGLSQVITQKKLLPPSLLKEEASLAAIQTAARGGKGTRPLQRLGQIISGDPARFTTPAQRFSAAKTFADPGLLPADATGKSLTRLTLSEGLGRLLGLTGRLAAGGGVLASPLALKKFIQTTSGARDIIKRVAGITGDLDDAAIEGVIQIIRDDPIKQRVLIQSLQGLSSQ